MIAKRGFTIIEMAVAAFLLGFVMLIFFYLMKTSFTATSKGQTAALTRETAKTALERIQLELRQAAPIPAGGAVPVPAVILPDTGGPLTSDSSANGEASSVGCSSSVQWTNREGGCFPGFVSVLNPSITVPQPIPGNLSTPTGFLIFSELKQSQSSGGNIYTPPDPNYTQNINNYVWVMYQVNPASASAPAQIVRYTFNVHADGTDIRETPGGWVRTDEYFEPRNSIEGNGNGVPIVSANNPQKDNIWMMVSHPLVSSSLKSETGMVYDPQLLIITAIVQEASQSVIQSNAPLDTATMSTQVNVEGAGQ